MTISVTHKEAVELLDKYRNIIPDFTCLNITKVVETTTAQEPKTFDVGEFWDYLKAERPDLAIVSGNKIPHIQEMRQWFCKRGISLTLYSAKHLVEAKHRWEGV